jgi:hypothetical protein
MEPLRKVQLQLPTFQRQTKLLEDRRTRVERRAADRSALPKFLSGRD